MDDHLTSLSVLSTIPAECHWLCNSVDGLTSVTVSLEERTRHVERLLSLFMEDLSDDGNTIEFLKNRLGPELAKCTECIPHYHRLKQDIISTLREDETWDETSIEELADTWTRWDITRTETQLMEAQRITDSMAPGTFKLSMLPPECLYALYDYLYSPALLKTPQGQTFVSVFTKIHEGSRKLKVRQLVPSAITFLFDDSNTVLQNWAAYVVRNCGSSVTNDTYEKDLRKPIREQFDKLLVQPRLLPSFFANSAILIASLPKEVVLHSVQLSKDNILYIALEHLADRPNSTEYYTEFLRVMCSYMESLGQELWDMVAPMSPQQFFSTVKSTRWFNEKSEKGEIEYMLFWLPNFVKSLPPIDILPTLDRIRAELLEPLQAPAARAGGIVAETLVRIIARIYRTALEKLLEAQTQIVHSIHFTNTLRAVEKHHLRLLQISPKVTLDDDAFQLLLLGLKLDAKMRVSPSEGKAYGEKAQQGSIWKFALEKVDLNSQAYAIILIHAVDYFVTVRLQYVRGLSSKEGMEKGLFGSLATIVEDLNERLLNLDSFELRNVLKDKPASNLLILSLLASEPKVYNPAVSILNEAFGTDTKVEGLAELLNSNLATTLVSFNFAMGAVIDCGSYSSIARTIRTISILTERFCQTPKTDVTMAERDAISYYWNYQWKFLRFVFEEIFNYQTSVKRAELENFTRDTMEFAEALFSARSTFANAIHGVQLPDDAERPTFELIIRRLLMAVKATVGGLVRWLKLRDEPLLLICHKLVCKLVKDFSNASIELRSEDRHMLFKFATGDPGSKYKNMLTSSQRKDLLQVLGEEEEPEVIEIPPPPKPVVPAEKKTQLPPKPATPTKPFSGIGYPTVAEQIAARKAAKAEALAKKKAEEESSSSSEEAISDDAMLFASIAAKKAKTKLLDAPATSGNRRATTVVKKTGQVRRRIADLTTLFRRILSWDYFHDSDLPPDNNGKPYASIPVNFDSVQHYVDTFEPLLMLETWWHLREAREDSNTVYSLKLSTRLNTDGFLELHFNVASTAGKTPDIRESDVLLISQSHTPKDDGKSPNCLGLVKSTKWVRKNLEIVVWSLPKNTVSTAFRVNQDLNASKILSLTTIEREFGALNLLPGFDLVEKIINAEPARITENDPKLTKSLESIYKLNEHQANAVASAMKNTGFTLIQGPPGTGKTKTIVGLAGSLLTPAEKKPRAGGRSKLLICAPSNAAVDEIVLRLSAGVLFRNGERYQPSIVRFGRAEAINSSIQQLTLDALVDIKLRGSIQSQNISLDDLIKKLDAAKKQREELRRQLDAARSEGKDPGDLSSKFKNAADLCRKIGRDLDQAREQNATERRNSEIRRRKAQQEILDAADIVCATLSGSGHETMRLMDFTFDAIIIDEAAQCIELSALIPMRFNCPKVVLVGDPKQLPPTVLSKEASAYQYEQSLFVRMQMRAPENVHLLQVQYRMHPDISLFPSNEFYDGKLFNGDGLSQIRASSWHSEIFSPFRFFSVEGFETSSNAGAYYNKSEVDAMIFLYRKLRSSNPRLDFGGKKIGVITPYRQQLFEIKRNFQSSFGSDILEQIEFNTADAFQGHENDIIFFSCVRSSPTKGIGFLNDIRRLNVALTRAKCSLFVLGNAEMLARNGTWKRLIDSAKGRNMLTSFSTLHNPNGGGVGARPAPAPLRIENVPKPNMERTPSAQKTPLSAGSDRMMIDVVSPANSRRPSIQDKLDQQSPNTNRPPPTGPAAMTQGMGQQMSPQGNSNNQDEQSGGEKIPKKFDPSVNMKARVAPPKKRPSADPFLRPAAKQKRPKHGNPPPPK